ncbi:MAG: hypothetical protein IMZ55_14515 [Acidobacteria bacterium]|nr:hypothetical protein [Acidobacteriota bacterium]
MKTIDKLLVAWAFISILFWSGYVLFGGGYTPFPLYFSLWIGGVGGIGWFFRQRLTGALQHWRRGNGFKFLILGYGMVLFEEIFAALANHLSEGFQFLVFIERIGQFWALNIFAFTGFIVGWYVLLSRVAYTNREVFYLSGAWGLFAEHVYRALFTNPMAFLLIAALEILTYGLIIMPAMLSMAPRGQRHIARPWKYLLTYGLLFVCSLAPIGILIVLRTHFPYLFPPEKFVAL